MQREEACDAQRSSRETGLEELFLIACPPVGSAMSKIAEVR